MTGNVTLPFYKRLEFKIFLRIALLFITVFSLANLMLNSWWIFAVLLSGIILYQLYELYHFHKKTLDELNNFVESVQYKDFSRRFDVTHAPSELQVLREGFNTINDAFKVITKEKETQYHYLQKILEMVNTGILSYEDETGEVIWMNESLKQMLHVPYLRTIHSLKKRDELMYNDIMDLKSGQGTISNVHHEKNNFKVLI